MFIFKAVEEKEEEEKEEEEEEEEEDDDEDKEANETRATGETVTIAVQDVGWREAKGDRKNGGAGHSTCLCLPVRSRLLLPVVL